MQIDLCCFVKCICPLTELGLTVQTEPSTVSVLDAAPYNTFSIVCTASVPTNVTATKSFVWRRGSSGTGSVLTSNNNTRITTLNPTNATSTSVLTTNVSSAGTHLYTCDVNVSSSLSSATTTAIVNGMMNPPIAAVTYFSFLLIISHCILLYYVGSVGPSQPTSVRYTNTTHSTATIEWRVQSITYTPETYYVEYGTSPSVLDQQSLSTGSGDDLTVMNQIYSLDITGLSSNTTYYYRVVSANSFASTRSSVGSFVTVSLRKINLYRNLC